MPPSSTLSPRPPSFATLLFGMVVKGVWPTGISLIPSYQPSSRGSSQAAAGSQPASLPVLSPFTYAHDFVGGRWWEGANSPACSAGRGCPLPPRRGMGRERSSLPKPGLLLGPWTASRWARRQDSPPSPVTCCPLRTPLLGGNTGTVALSTAQLLFRPQRIYCRCSINQTFKLSQFSCARVQASVFSNSLKCSIFILQPLASTFHDFYGVIYLFKLLPTANTGRGAGPASGW